MSEKQGTESGTKTDTPQRHSGATIALGVIAVLLIGAIGWLAWVWWGVFDGRGVATERDRVLTAAHGAVVTMNSLDGDDPEGTLEEIRTVITGEDINAQIDQAEEALLGRDTEGRRISVEVTDIALESFDAEAGIAEVFAVLNQTAERPDTGNVVQRVIAGMTMTKVDGKWLVSASDYVALSTPIVGGPGEGDAQQDPAVPGEAPAPQPEDGAPQQEGGEAPQPEEGE
ncbi:hypothetical protein HT102_15140 [Hoyosella sp. G463]|uniref:Mce-associated membrane protein n=1 Tax=Lolliginicoccus lacisalsi TaxID=2742202 RepID=A0A927JET4_9ACTN|nr:hypothetical protein [Lolliginicoccus lacisalsi]MBD8507823.1 hypothetical protein [Lolliginicoccus lacisalsi]